MMRTIIGFLVSIIFALFCLKDSSAQSPELRYQLGRRLTRFERDWQLSDSASRARSTPKMMAAVNSFFSLQLDTAIVKLDEAWLALQSEVAIETAQRISDAGWYLSVRPLMMDSEVRTLNLTLLHQPLGAALAFPTANCDLSVTVQNSLRTQVRKRRWESVSNKDSLLWVIEPLPPGDYQVTATFHRENSDIDVIANCFSVVSDLEKRFEPVRNFAVGSRSSVNDSKSLSIQSISRMIAAGNDSRVSESDLPFDALLSDLEFLANEKSTVRELIAARPDRSIWLQLGNGKSRQHVRLQTPAKPKGAPLVVAFHGAGGSENMFFESYGAGALIDHCRQRGWSVISPRQSLVGLGMDLEAMLDELQIHLDFDPEKVFLIGHSMGAAQAVSQASKHPRRVRAVAAIGGGGLPTKSNELSDVPFFVAAGSRDFGLPQAQKLHKTLQELNVQVEFREVKDVEHMVIVQAILPEAIAFFEMK